MNTKVGIFNEIVIMNGLQIQKQLPVSVQLSESYVFSGRFDSDITTKI